MRLVPIVILLSCSLLATPDSAVAAGELTLTGPHYRPIDDLEAGIEHELGDYKLADWNDLDPLARDLEPLLDRLGVERGEIVLLTYNGKRFDGPQRHFFAQRGTPHAGALVYARYGDSLWLGSWYGYENLRALARPTCPPVFRHGRDCWHESDHLHGDSVPHDGDAVHPGELRLDSKRIELPLARLCGDAKLNQGNIELSTHPYSIQNNPSTNNQQLRLRSHARIVQLRLHFVLRNGWFKPAGFVVRDGRTGVELYRAENSIEMFERTVTLTVPGLHSIVVEPTSASGDYVLFHQDSSAVLEPSDDDNNLVIWGRS